MKLYSTPTSPFSRKVRMVMLMRGVNSDIEIVNASPSEPDSPGHQANPLRKIPALHLDDGGSMFDSRVIAEFVDSLGTAGEPLFPQGPDRWRSLTLQALADGMCDAAILCAYESRYRPEEKWHQPWVDRQMLKVNAALDRIESDLPPTDRVTIGEIALACNLPYVELRLGDLWKQGRPGLVAWLQGFGETVPEYKATAPD